VLSSAAISLGALLLPLTVAHADGLLLAPSDVLRGFSEQAQVAVMDVRPDQTVTVDLFISLMDTSAESHEVDFLLPLQTLPKGFQATEVSGTRFSKQKLGPLDSIIHTAARHARGEAWKREKLYDLGALLAGPLAVVWAGPWDEEMSRGLGGSGAAEPPGPEMTVRTEHTKVAIYASLKPDELQALANLPEMPPQVRQVLAGYVGRPFALVHMRTLPGVATIPRGASPVGPPDLGIHFAFTQGMLPEEGTKAVCYRFPLGTGQGWTQPIGLSEIAVTAPDSLNLDVNCPDRNPETEVIQKGVALGRTIGAAARGRQLWYTVYWDENPSRDVEIRLRPGPSAFQRSRVLAPWRHLGWVIGFPAIALAAWLGSYWLVARGGPNASRRVFWRGAVVVWPLMQSLLLAPMVFANIAWWSSRPEYSLREYAYQRHIPHAPVGLLLGGIGLAGLVWMSLSLRRRGKQPGIPHAAVALVCIAVAMIAPSGLSRRSLLEYQYVPAIVHGAWRRLLGAPDPRDFISPYLLWTQGWLFVVAACVACVAAVGCAAALLALLKATTQEKATLVCRAFICAGISGFAYVMVAQMVSLAVLR
jgi:hypothetical protein